MSDTPRGWKWLRQQLGQLAAKPEIARWGAPIRTIRRTTGFHAPRASLTKARQILVIRPDEIGDVVLTSPFLRELRRAAPRARITLMVKPACYPLVEHCPYVDAVYTLPRWGGVRLVWAVWRLRLRPLPWRGFDLVLLPRYDTDRYNSELLAHLLAGKGTVIAQQGPAQPARARTAKLFHLETYTNPKIEHEALLPLRLLGRLNRSPTSSSQLELWLTEADHRTAAQEIARQFPGAARLIVIHPSGGRSALKQWPVARFRSLLHRLHEETPCNFLIVGGPDEGWIEEAFTAARGDRVAVAIGHLTLRELGAAFMAASLFIGGDSGPMHIAAAAGVPVIAIFGPTSETRFRPLGSRCRVISLRLPCSPDMSGTFADRCATCRFAEQFCLTELQVDTVVGAANAALAGNVAPASAATHALSDAR